MRSLSYEHDTLEVFWEVFVGSMELLTIFCIRSILKGSARESLDSGKQSLSSTPSLPKQRLRSGMFNSKAQPFWSLTFSPDQFADIKVYL
jgi:hypothetical protein